MLVALFYRIPLYLALKPNWCFWVVPRTVTVLAPEEGSVWISWGLNLEDFFLGLGGGGVRKTASWLLRLHKQTWQEVIGEHQQSRKGDERGTHQLDMHCQTAEVRTTSRSRYNPPNACRMSGRNASPADHSQLNPTLCGKNRELSSCIAQTVACPRILF